MTANLDAEERAPQVTGLPPVVPLSRPRPCPPPSLRCRKWPRRTRRPTNCRPRDLLVRRSCHTFRGDTRKKTTDRHQRTPISSLQYQKRALMARRLSLVHTACRRPPGAREHSCFKRCNHRQGVRQRQATLPQVSVTNDPHAVTLYGITRLERMEKAIVLVQHTGSHTRT